MRYQKNERVADDRYDVESQKRAAMSPKIDNHTAGVGVNRAEQCAQRVVETDHENARAQRLQKFRHESHAELFSRANHENEEEKNDKIVLQIEKVVVTREAAQVQLLLTLPLQ